IGKSGSGKSTLLNMISGLDKADSGEIIINGKNIMELNEKELADFRGKELGFVFQEFNLIPVLSVWDNVVLPVKISKEIIDNEYIENVMKMLEIYDKKDVLPQKLSGGQKQRVAIARALANKPCIIMADEPTGNLDGETGDKVLKLLIDGIRKYNQTLVMVTHDMDIAAKADKILHL
ncbi:MAG: ABC transporter ATP-binding protein, partial [Lachnospiraceae bacterium]|nr:ABC transporter ATP-binding protein [Lachnospiraceae bacterium]